MKRSLLTASTVLALATTLTACGESESSSDSSGGGDAAGSGDNLAGQIAGMGASSQQAAVENWVAQFGKANSDVTVNYDPQGSGAGREQFADGAVDFAGTDSAFADEELDAAKKRCDGDIVQVPSYVSPIAIAYNVEGVDELNLKPETVAKIFKGEITKWNDKAIAADNPDAKLPDTAIATVNRSDDSGTSKNFSEYLGMAAPKAWDFEPDDVWPVKGKGTAAKGTSGVIDAVKSGKGTIGYADLSQVGDLGTVKLGVGDEFVEPSAESAGKILDASKAASESETDLAVDVAKDTEESGVYPNVLVSYMAACQKYDDAEKAKLVKAWMGYITSTEGQQAAADGAGSAPLPAEWVKKAQTAVESIS